MNRDHPERLDQSHTVRGQSELSVFRDVAEQGARDAGQLGADGATSVLNQDVDWAGLRLHGHRVSHASRQEQRVAKRDDTVQGRLDTTRQTPVHLWIDDTDDVIGLHQDASPSGREGHRGDLGVRCQHSDLGTALCFERIDAADRNEVHRDAPVGFDVARERDLANILVPVELGVHERHEHVVRPRGHVCELVLEALDGDAFRPEDLDRGAGFVELEAHGPVEIGRDDAAEDRGDILRCLETSTGLIDQVVIGVARLVAGRSRPRNEDVAPLGSFVEAPLVDLKLRIVLLEPVVGVDQEVVEAPGGVVGVAKLERAVPHTTVDTGDRIIVRRHADELARIDTAEGRDAGELVARCAETPQNREVVVLHSLVGLDGLITFPGHADKQIGIGLGRQLLDADVPITSVALISDRDVTDILFDIRGTGFTGQLQQRRLTIRD